jgi:hypothetical protein
LVATSPGRVHALRGAGRMPTLPLSSIRSVAKAGDRSNVIADRDKNAARAEAKDRGRDDG